MDSGGGSPRFRESRQASSVESKARNSLRVPGIGLKRINLNTRKFFPENILRLLPISIVGLAVLSMFIIIDQGTLEFLLTGQQQRIFDAASYLNSSIMWFKGATETAEIETGDGTQFFCNTFLE